MRSIALAIRIFVMLVAAGIFSTLSAEEKNGLIVNVSKKTLDRADTRSNYTGDWDRIDRTQGLKVTVKNTSFKDRGEGEVKWKILVRKYLSTSIVSYTGTEKLKGLKPAETAEMTIGSAQILGWKDSNEQYKDKIEYQVIIEHGGTETIKVSSTSSFDALAKRATPGAQN